MSRDRLIRLWQRTDTWPVWIAAYAEPILARLICRLHGHAEFLEMDNTSICCAVCAKYLRPAREDEKIKWPKPATLTVLPPNTIRIPYGAGYIYRQGRIDD